MMSSHRSVRAGYPVPDFLAREVASLQEAARLMSQTVYGAALWSAGVRRETHYMVAFYCVLDFDEGVTKAEARAKLEGFRYVLGTTKSDGKEKVRPNGRVDPPGDRFRVLLPFKQPIWNIEVFRYNMRHRIAQFGSDAAPFDGGRVWQPSPLIETIREDGEELDVIMTIPVEETTAYQQKKIQDYVGELVKQNRLPKRTLRFLDGDIAPAKRNNELFVAACNLFQFGWNVGEVRKLVYSIPEMRDHDKIETTIRSAAKRTGAAYF